jgi:hypothetical protein
MAFFAAFLHRCCDLPLGPIVKRAVRIAGIDDNAAVKENHRVPLLISSQFLVNRSGLLSMAAIASAKVGLRRGREESKSNLRVFGRVWGGRRDFNGASGSVAEVLIDLFEERENLPQSHALFLISSRLMLPVAAIPHG